MVQIDTIQLQNGNNGGADTTFQCRYSSDVQISSSPFTITDTHATDSTVGLGSFDTGFTLNAFTDDSFSSPIGSTSSVFIGQTIYVQALWALSIGNNLKFYVDKCNVIIGASSITIINNNCYSKTFGTRMLTQPHLQQSASKFQFNSFTLSSNAVEQVTEIVCNIRMCVTASSNCQLTTSPDCTNLQPTSGYSYSFNGN